MGTQEELQLLIMEEIRDRGFVTVEVLRRHYPRADSRDLLRALQILLAFDCIERASPLSSAPLDRIAAGEGGLLVTEVGHRMLAEAE